ncbi:hypothetical protein N5W20_03680 [Candidatus Kirkpatrickella diaphorinae]|uniref:Pertussis toxin subunit 1 n=1 Tax=Candidatus Kirkpatrickella diaphorinae TaxID=2984322 RepID=A0ABY6GK92_9PROT|nr:hypothetical protein [Candidatus Kirkpatrickella diaphorinae]UYH51967.1 hypothetical protein N5W20_03680 [Candidatus Kirkpatrickella diaphorinae]
MKSKAAIPLIVTMILTASAYAKPPPVTYRLSSYAPGIVFDQGFTARGENYDFLSYISGNSITEDTSGYLVSTSSLNAAINILRRRLRTHPDERYFLYTIRPTSNFYNVAQSIEYARDNLPDSPARAQVNTLWILTDWHHEEYWVARDGISPNQIMGGQSISLDGRTVQFGEYLQNAGYEYAPPVVSRRLMPIRNNTVDAAYGTEEEAGASFVPAGIDNMVCEASRQRRAAPQSEQCLTTTKITFRQLWTKTVARMIATGILMGSTSNQLLAEPGHDEL